MGSSQGSDPRHIGKGTVAWLAVLVLVTGVVLRWSTLGATSLWFDEAFTWWVALQTPGRIIEIIRADTWPPLYYLMMHVWIGVFGDSVWAMRAQSAAASSLALLLAGALGWRVFRTSGARLLALMLLALSATQLEYSDDVRCYATASLFVAATIWCISRRVEGAGRRWLIGYALAATALVYQHNLMWLYLVSMQGAWILWPGTQGLRSRLRDMFAGNMVVGLLFAPWAPSLLAQMRHLDAAFWTQRPTFYELTLLTNWATGVHTELLRDAGWRFAGIDDATDRLTRLPVFALVVGVCVFAVLGTHGSARRRVLSLLVAGMGPILLAFAYSQFRRSIFVDRCFTPSSLLLAIAVAGIAQTSWKWRGRVVGLAFVMLAALSAALLMGYPDEEPWEQALREVQRTSRDGDQLLFFATEGELVYDYFALHLDWDPLPSSGVPRDLQAGNPPRVQVPVLSMADLQPLEERLGSPLVQRVVLIRAHEGGLDKTGIVDAYLGMHWTRTRTHRRPYITVDYYERKQF